jgi:hypothetical protein
MTPVIQTKVVVKNSKDEIVVHGNCYAAAIASMLDLPITQVPNIEVFFDTSFDFKWLMNAWLREKHNMKIEWAEEFEIFHEGFEEGDRYDDAANARRLELSDEIYLAIGPSPRGVSHVCIYQGGEMIHDPHPTGEGLLKVESFQKIVPLEAGESKVAPPSPPSVKLDGKRAVIIDETAGLGQKIARELAQPSVKPLSEIDTTIQAIRRHTEDLIAQGPDACRKFLKDAGISTDETPGEASVKPERGDGFVENRSFADQVHQAIELMEHSQPSPTALEWEIPEECLPISLSVLRGIEEAWTADRNQGSAPDWYVNGAVYMYREMRKLLYKQNIAILGHIKTRQDLQSQLSAKETEAAEYRKSLEEIKARGFDYVGEATLPTYLAETADETLKKYPPSKTQG